MAGLTVSYADLLRAIGRTLGWGDAYSDWSSDTSKVADAEDFISSGLRRVYFPGPMGGDTPHQWSFLTPIATLTTEAAQASYRLPADFVQIKAGFSFAAGSAGVRMSQKPEASIRELQRDSDKQGRPEFYAIRAVPVLSGGSPGYEVVFWPSPDAEYELTYRYVLSPPELSNDNPYHLGGPQYSELILESVLASAERFLNDEEQIHDKQFKDLLLSSIQMDASMSRDEGDGEDVWEEQIGTNINVSRKYLRRLIGRELGYGPHPGLWTRAQIEEVKLCLEQGLRKFYSPAILPGEGYAHEWTFLRPLAQLDVSADQYTYDLPADFSLLIGPFTYAASTTVLHCPVEVRGEEYIRHRRQWAESAGRPTLAALIPKYASEGEDVGWEVTFWPTPDGAYTLQYRYQINPEGMNEDASLPIGGQYHAQTILKACLTAAEEMRGVRDGLHSRAFLECLRASVGHDRKLNSPDTLGYTTDGGQQRGWHRDHHDYDESLVTYRGY